MRVKLILHDQKAFNLGMQLQSECIEYFEQNHKDNGWLLDLDNECIYRFIGVHENLSLGDELKIGSCLYSLSSKSYNSNEKIIEMRVSKIGQLKPMTSHERAIKRATNIIDSSKNTLKNIKNKLKNSDVTNVSQRQFDENWLQDTKDRLEKAQKELETLTDNG